MTSFVKLNITLPNNYEQSRTYLQDILNSHAESINQRDIGVYDLSENSTGQLWPNPLVNPQAQNSTFRLIVPIQVDFSANPNEFPHGIDPIGYVFTHIYGSIGNGENLWIPLPYPGTNQVLVYVTASDVVVDCSNNFFDGFNGYVVLEYLKVV